MRQKHHYLYQRNEPEKYLKQCKERAQSARERNRRILATIKVEKGCEICGYNKHPVALDFDHKVQSEKSMKIGGATCAIDRLLEEVKKCRVLCANCHRVESYEKGHHLKGRKRQWKNPN